MQPPPQSNSNFDRTVFFLLPGQEQKDLHEGCNLWIVTEVELIVGLLYVLWMFHPRTPKLLVV